MSEPPALRRPLILASIMTGLFMIAIEVTIVSTAMPQIVSQLGDLHLYAWVFSAFLLTQTASTVVFGKLADLYGRKPVLLAGIAIFLVGSVLCGFAGTMTALIAFRLVQGLGAGAIQPIALTVVGDLYSVEERGRIQGWLASVWGISSVVGPLAGGLIISHVSWAWVFWINVPVGIASGLGFWFFLHERVRLVERKVDVLGAALFTLAIAALMICLTELGTGHPGVVLGSLAAFVVIAVLFVLQELRAPDPMIDFSLWSRRPIATANAATLLSGALITGMTTFLPMYVQGVMGQSALVAGFTLTAMVLGWPIAATIAARNMSRFGLRGVLLFGATLLPVGAAVFVFVGPGTSPVVAGLGSIVIGFGMGFMSTAAILIVQESVGWENRGSATASNIFSRNFGSTLGAAMLGGVLNITLSHAGTDGAAFDFDQVRSLLSHGTAVLADISTRAALDQGLHTTFWVILAITVITTLLATLVPAVRFKAGPRELVE